MKQYLDLQKEVQEYESSASCVTSRRAVIPLNKGDRISKSCEL